MKGYLNISDSSIFEKSELSETELQAFDFCKRYGVRIDAKEIAERPDGIGNDWGGLKYRVVIRRAGKQFTLYFTDSAANKHAGRRPTCYDILACIEKDFPGDMADFIAEFGYTIDSAEEFRRIERIYKAVKREVAGVRRMFGEYGEPCFDELCEIC